MNANDAVEILCNTSVTLTLAHEAASGWGATCVDDDFEVGGVMAVGRRSIVTQRQLGLEWG